MSGGTAITHREQLNPPESCVCPECFHIASGTFLLGFLFGSVVAPLIIAPLFRVFYELRHTLRHRIKSLCNAAPAAINNRDKVVTEELDEAMRNKILWRKGIVPNQRNRTLSKFSASFNRSLISIRGALFANSMRKMSSISGIQYGLIEARGKVPKSLFSSTGRYLTEFRRTSASSH
jgi:hypothetical protein